jgi:hypothetical protein
MPRDALKLERPLSGYALLSKSQNKAFTAVFELLYNKLPFNQIIQVGKTIFAIVKRASTLTAPSLYLMKDKIFFASTSPEIVCDGCNCNLS